MVLVKKLERWELVWKRDRRVNHGKLKEKREMYQLAVKNRFSALDVDEKGSKIDIFNEKISRMINKIIKLSLD